MIRKVCKYAGFKCGLILENVDKKLIADFIKEFNFYYEFEDYDDKETECDAYIYVVDEAFDGTIESEEICIHSSHSENRKYLLDGSSYAKEDANIYANVKREENVIYYYISKLDVKVRADLEVRCIYISGSNGELYNMFSYVFETLLSISIEHSGGIQLHAACCQWKGKGYIITGHSGSGKTTLMFNMLKSGGVFHSNDRVAIFKENENYIAYSIPIPVNVPVSMMRTLKNWKELKLIKEVEENSKIRFLVKNLRLLFLNNRVKKVVISDILAVEHTDAHPTYRFISDKSDKKYLEVLSPFDENHPKWLPIFDYPNEKSVEEKLDVMRRKVRTIKLEGNELYKALEDSLGESNMR